MFFVTFLRNYKGKDNETYRRENVCWLEMVEVQTFAGIFILRNNYDKFSLKQKLKKVGSYLCKFLQGLALLVSGGPLRGLHSSRGHVTYLNEGIKE
jgi:hypothetical protein